MLDRIPGLGSKSLRRRVDDLFSREVLGSVLVGASAGKVVEKTILHFAPDVTSQLIAWSIAAVGFMALFVGWEYAERAVGSATDAAADAVDGDGS